MSAEPAAAVPAALLPAPVLVAAAGRALWLEADGAATELTAFAAARRALRASHMDEGGEAARRASHECPILCHAPATAARLDCARFPARDILELFAFVRPAQFCLPTPAGVARAMSLPRPPDLEAQARTLATAAHKLLAELKALPMDAALAAARICAGMAEAGWPWAPAVAAALPTATAPGGYDVWRRLPEWNETAPRPAPESVRVTETEARKRLRSLLGPNAEARPPQSDYAALAAAAFLPRDQADKPHAVLAEAGTGIGKTLGYIAPASLWTEKSGGTVWLSTYTKNLQRQIDQELDRLYPDPAQKARKVVVRKGRENYLCLLNAEEAVGAARPADRVALALIVRWAEASRDGDMTGGDFPAWLVELLGARRTIALADRRGECIYSACPHYRRCFIERGIRRARRADIVIANHALVMTQAALTEDPRDLPVRYVFDEGHHLFDAADSAFSAHLSAAEAAELRRWLRGAEGQASSRARGLEKRLGDLLDTECAVLAHDIVQAARVLPADGWAARLAQSRPNGATEAFLALVRQQVFARAADPDSPYGLECTPAEPVPGLVDAADALAAALGRLGDPLKALAVALAKRLASEADELDTSTRVRIEAALAGIARRGQVLATWAVMLRGLRAGTPPEFVDWLDVARDDGRERDVGFHRHWRDPTVPFADAVLRRAHGALITSATLRDRSREGGDDWKFAEARSGARHLPLPARRASFPSPFDHAGRTRVLVVTDVRRDEVDQVAAAYRELFRAAKGGALGLFTAIWRLRAVHGRMAKALAADGISLYAQHVDPIDTATLVDIFRADVDSCLLGTDAVRDGVDVPGRSLRLIVFDRVPWPRPDILHRARREAMGGQVYDDMLTRLRLKQAYGRLLRRADDMGVFVVLDPMLPSRLLSAFPAEVEVRRLGLAQAVAETRAFLSPLESH